MNVPFWFRMLITPWGFLISFIFAAYSSYLFQQGYWYCPGIYSFCAYVTLLLGIVQFKIYRHFKIRG